MYLDAVARSLMAYEPQTILQVVDLVQREYEWDATELGATPDRVSDLDMLHTLLTYFVDYHIHQSDPDTRIDDEGA